MLHGLGRQTDLVALDSPPPCHLELGDRHRDAIGVLHVRVGVRRRDRLNRRPVVLRAVERLTGCGSLLVGDCAPFAAALSSSRAAYHAPPSATRRMPPLPTGYCTPACNAPGRSATLSLVLP